FFRYLWYIIRLLAAFTYRPVPIPENPTYIAPEDVTIIVPTIDAGEEFKEAAHSWLVGKPKEILIITEEKMLGPLQDLANAVDPERIRVLTVPFANKRLQMSHGIKNTTTDIIVFADDDAIWPPTMLPYMLAPFEDQKVGGVGTSQRVQPVGNRMTVWEVLAAFRLTIRNIEIASATHIDGGIPCLSGRTAAYRTVILKDPDFLHGFTHDYWLGKYQLNSGDDKFLTRWMVSHGWNTGRVVEYDEAELAIPQASAEMDTKYVAVGFAQSFHGTICLDITSLRRVYNVPYQSTKEDIIYPGAFGYYFAVMKLYALFTLHETGWGTRAGIGDASAATAAMDQQNEKQLQQDHGDVNNNNSNNNYPYRQGAGGLSSQNEPPYSAYRDQSPSPFDETPPTPIYSSRAQGQGGAGGAGGGGMRRRGADEEMEMQVGYAR
ncbi:hypothetical protein H0H93_002793, partial [Arthromyces matolae]